MKIRTRLAAALVAAICSASTAWAADAHHNVVIFVADGLRHNAVDTGFMPTFAAFRKSGVDFVNSHSLLPTFTTPNASAIATGHYIGDTGDYGNTMFLGYPSIQSDSWGATHPVENNSSVPDINEHFSGNFFKEESLVGMARRSGFNTAIIGKLGPALVLDITRNNFGITPENVHTVLIDDRTGAGAPRNGERGSIPLPTAISRRIANDPFLKAKYFNNQAPANDPITAPRGANGSVGTKQPNSGQQQYLMDTVTHAILPAFTEPAGNRKPFVLVYWSRDPDGTQHNQLDGPDQITPGINGDTVHKAFQNVDGAFSQLLEYLKTTPDPNTPDKKLIDTTNIFITSDHGFSTVSRGVIDTQGTRVQSFATQQRYQGVAAGLLPPGFVAIDLAHDLNLPLYDADQSDATGAGEGLKIQHRPLRIEAGAAGLAQHPSGGSGLIGGTGIYDKDGYNTSLVVVAAGGSDLIYAPAQRPRNNQRPADQGEALIRKAVASLVTKPYISGVFVDTERFGPVPGALSISDINLRGSAVTPVPAIVVNLRTFSTDPANPYMTGVVLADASYRQGQGTHGSFGRQDTYNCMMASGPDFKTSFSDPDPVSNADIAITLSHLLGIDLRDTAKGRLTGRLLDEALVKGPAPRGSKALQMVSSPAENGITTVLQYQVYSDAAGNTFKYFDAAGFPGTTVGVEKK